MWTEKGMQLWGGIECTVNRVGDRFHDQFFKGGHLDRLDDLDRIAELGVRTLRYPILWERTAPERPDERDWRFADERLGRLRDLGIEPIVGLVHHGSGPRYTNLLDGSFAPGLADHARAVAERFPWIEAYTPVNEPLTTARFSTLYGHWYPHATDERSFAQALLNQVRATVLSMRAIREVNPAARLVQTDDLGRTHATTPLRYQAEFDNERRWLGWDLLCGRVDRQHRMWGHFLEQGVDEAELAWFLEDPCPPDVVGVNYYLTSERFLDHRIDRYPPDTHGANWSERFADVEAVRVLAGGIDGPGRLLREAWERYGLPLAITECHLGCTREEQVRWLAYVWGEAEAARQDGVDVEAVTVWSLFGAHDWCSLLTCDANLYEPGVFDLRAPEPRPTALARAVRTLACEGTMEASGEGWWERPVRLLYPPALAGDDVAPVPAKRRTGPRRSILILEDDRGLARAFASRCELRGLDYVLAGRDETDPLCPASVRHALDLRRPWAVVSPDGGGSALARGCAEVGARVLVLSDERVFDGTKGSPYVESDPPQCDWEWTVLGECPHALIVRVGTLFGVPTDGDFVSRTLAALERGERVVAACEGVVSPTFVPHLVDATLDLLVDDMAGIVHLTSEAALTPVGFARRIAAVAGLAVDLVDEAPPDPKDCPSIRCGLRSERAWPMPPLDEALAWAIRDVRDGARIARTYVA